MKTSLENTPMGGLNQTVPKDASMDETTPTFYQKNKTSLMVLSVIAAIALGIILNKKKL